MIFPCKISSSAEQIVETTNRVILALSTLNIWTFDYMWISYYEEMTANISPLTADHVPFLLHS